jgi:N6-adenosine-specific RNA methylase IME4
MSSLPSPSGEERQPVVGPVPTTGIPFHPIANLFPLIEGAEFDELVADVRENDVHEIIWILDGMVLDGRNRFRAAVAGNLPWVKDDVAHWLARATRGDGGGITRTPHMMLYDERVMGDPLKYVLSLNLRRRHLNESQRILIAAEIAKLPQGRPSERNKPAKSPDSSHVEHDAPTQGEAAAMLNVAERSVRRGRQVIEHGAPELVDAVRSGKATVGAAVEVAKLPIEEQVELLKHVDPRALAKVAKERRAIVQGGKAERRDEREKALAAQQQALPDRRYGVILADPEWRFEPYSRQSGMDRAADNHYPTSSLDDIKARPVASISADDCVLFLWATPPMLPQALEVMAAWGFAYKSHVIWRKADKVTGVHTWSGKGGGLVLGTGYWFRSAHELLLVGTRGSVPAPAMGTQKPSMFDAPPRRHSEKPDAVYELIEAYFPNLPKIELNARARRDGWDAWGFEAPETEGHLELLAEQTAGDALPMHDGAPVVLPPFNAYRHAFRKPEVVS